MMYDHWVQAANLGQVSGAIFLDLSAAFYLVPHIILLRKLEIYGVEKDFLCWIESVIQLAEKNLPGVVHTLIFRHAVRRIETKSTKFCFIFTSKF